MKNLKKTVYLLSSLFIASCATVDNANKSTRYHSIEEVDQYSLYGRSAVHSPEFSGQVTLNIAQSRPGYLEIAIAGALGKGRTEIKITPEQSILEVDNRTYRGQNPDELFKKVTDIAWPVSGSIQWIKGKPSDPTTHIYYDENNRPLLFNEAGWEIRYQEWMTINGLPLPKRMTLTRDDIRLRLFIENWEF